MRRAGILLLLLGVAFSLRALVALQEAEPPFPHEKHERVFPVCEGCHAGVVSGVEAELYPAETSCAECHDGERVEEVEWTPPGPRESNLRFFHPDHRDLVRESGENATCLDCHAEGEPPATRMSVASAQPDLCLACHAHPGERHLEVPLGADCTGCHLPLTEADRLTSERIADFPWPESHDRDDFLSTHAPETAVEQFSCSVCHTRDTCERCHLNADRLDAVTALGLDARVARLELGKEPEYPLPPSHEEPGWLRAHGPATRADPAGCANCHARPSCLGCHLEGEARALVMEFLAPPTPARPRGVEIARPGDRVHPVDFQRNHRQWAATGALECAECHSERYCADCHAGTSSREFHPPNFIERHAVEVFSAGADCQSCHSTERFCRDCHAGSGVASRGAMNLAFHDAQPLWILAHGQAARTGLESCAACHGQNDCLACHSATRGWGVNPHGPAFDAGRAAARNRQTCQWCHLGDPLGR